MRALFLSLILSFLYLGCYNASSEVSDDTLTKINGIAFTAPPQPCSERDFETVAETGATWVNLIPYAFCRPDDPHVQFDVDGQWWGERKVGIEKCIELARSSDLKIMVKPQLWLMGGKFTGDLTWKIEKEWQTFETSYEKYILDFARISEANKVELFCIGTELAEFIKARPEFWKQLINKIKEVYSGKLTYAANWDEYARVPFWSELDYVGVDAYFPLLEEKTPSVENLNGGWKVHHAKLEKFSGETGMPILFTEYGYRSMDFCASKPWESYTDVPLNLEAQANCYRSIHQQFWGEDWFTGGFLWKWHTSATGDISGGASNFSPQGKPALQVLKKNYGSVSR